MFSWCLSSWTLDRPDDGIVVLPRSQNLPEQHLKQVEAPKREVDAKADRIRPIEELRKELADAIAEAIKRTRRAERRE